MVCMLRKYKLIIMMTIISNILSCASLPAYNKTVDKIEIQKFMGTWYVHGGRFTPFEKDVYNGVETYTWNSEKKRIDIGFTYNQGGFDGPIKSLPQKGWIYNEQTQAHWKVSPLWPLKFNYLIIGLGDSYNWTVIGVPDQKYVWIMSREKIMSDELFDQIVFQMKSSGYDMNSLVRVKHK